MKMKRAALLLPLFAAVYALAFAAPPVYPGAKAVDELNEAARKAGQETMAYNTLDPLKRSMSSTKAKAPRSQRRTGIILGKNLP